jgi:DNA-binding transcriptional MerR regulator
MPHLPQQFDARQAGAYAGVTQRQIRYWDQTGLVRPSVQSTGGRPGVPRLYSRNDVLRLRAIQELLVDGQSLQRVRIALVDEAPRLKIVAEQFDAIWAQFAAEERQTDWQRDWPEYQEIVTAGRAA